MATKTKKLEGRIEGLPFDQYMAADAVSSTKLKTIYSEGTAAHALIMPKPETEALALGAAMHCKTTRPGELDAEVMVADASFKTRTAAKFKSYCADFPGKTVLLEKEVYEVDVCSEAARSHPRVKEYLADGIAEVSYIGRDDEFGGISVKSREDWAFGDTAVDFKFMRRANPHDFRRDAVYNFHYDLQAAWYSHVRKVVTGTPLRRFYFVVIDKSLAMALHKAGRPTCEAVAIYEFSEEALDRGAQKWRDALDVWTSYLEAKQKFDVDWAGYAQEVVEIA